MSKSDSFKYPLPIGTVLKGGNLNYRITQVLGQGSYGITYKATAIVNLANISEEWAFAIKENFAKDYCSRASDGVTMTYPGEHAEEAERDLREFIYEGDTLQKICNANSNIIDVNETFKENNTAYYVMKFIEGEDLYKYVKRKDKLDEHSAIEILKPIADAVSHLHDNRRMHLDVKPENIMIRKDGTPILIDFGTVLHFSSTGQRTGTSKDRSIACSDGYAPMEQYLGIEIFSPETDVYALGATLLFMLTGNEPPKASELSLKAMEASIPKNISKRTRDALVHAMQPLKDDRTATAAAFLKEIALGGDIVNSRSKNGETKVSTENNKGTKKLDNTQKATHTEYSITDNSEEEEEVIVPEEESDDSQESNTVFYIFIVLAVLAVLVYWYISLRNEGQKEIYYNQTSEVISSLSVEDSLELHRQDSLRLADSIQQARQADAEQKARLAAENAQKEAERLKEEQQKKADKQAQAKQQMEQLRADILQRINDSNFADIQGDPGWKALSPAEQRAVEALFYGFESKAYSGAQKIYVKQMQKIHGPFSSFNDIINFAEQIKSDIVL